MARIMALVNHFKDSQVFDLSWMLDTPRNPDTFTLAARSPAKRRRIIRCSRVGWAQPASVFAWNAFWHDGETSVKKHLASEDPFFLAF